MELNTVILNVIDLPKKFRFSNDKSIFALLAETGYFDMHAQISERAVYDELSERRDYISEWLRFSEDKRSPGWFLSRRADGKYLVGNTAGSGDPISYEDEVAACAAFIKREIDSIRQS
jgi:hypothetical protein